MSEVDLSTDDKIDVLNENTNDLQLRFANSDSHGFALKSLTNLKIKEILEKPDESNKEKSKANELYTEKLIKTVHFLAHNNLPVK